MGEISEDTRENNRPSIFKSKGEPRLVQHLIITCIRQAVQTKGKECSSKESSRCLCGEERCMTTQITAGWETRYLPTSDLYAL